MKMVCISHFACSLSATTDLGLLDSLLSEELFGPICPVVKADYVSAYKKVSRYVTIE